MYNFNKLKIIGVIQQNRTGKMFYVLHYETPNYHRNALFDITFGGIL